MFLPWRSGQEADTHVHQYLVQCSSAAVAVSVPFCTLMPATCGEPLVTSNAKRLASSLLSHFSVRFNLYFHFPFEKFLLGG
jgi:hypothetical protein